jgi:hypothetical protein
MSNSELSPQENLRFAIAKLKMEKQMQGEHTKFVFQELIGTVDNVAIIKNFVTHLAQNKDVQFELIKKGMKYGSKLLIDKFYPPEKENQSIISTEFLESTANAFIDSNAASMIVKISDWMNPQKKSTQL